MGTHQQDVARVTNEQKSRWDDSSRSYSEVLIRKGAPEPNTRQVIAAVQLHTKDKTGARGVSSCSLCLVSIIQIL